MIRVEVVGPFPSAANLREHPMARFARVQLVHERVTAALQAQPVTPPMLADPLGTGRQVLVVRLTRLSPRGFDDDNLAGSLKGARDSVARWIGIDDRELQRLRFFTYQDKGPTVVIPPTGRQKKAKRWQTVRIEIRPEYVHTPLGVELEELRRRAELATIALESAEAEAKDVKLGNLEEQLGGWLGVGR